MHGDGTYDITYDDGDFEAEVDPANVRRLEDDDGDTASQQSGQEGAAAAAGVVYGVGEQIEGNFGGQGSWFPGKISFANGDGTYDIVYDDGDAEKGVPASLIRNPEEFDGDSQSTNSQAKPQQQPLKPGDAIEANYGGGGSWFPGRVGSVNADGTFDIRYDDGDAEQGVSAELVRRVGGEPAAASEEYAVGEAVAAKFANQGSWFPGRVGRVNSDDGTYDIVYDDGDEENNVPTTRIRKVAAAAGAAAAAAPTAGATGASSSFAVGDRVEADYGGEGSFFPGKITAVASDGTYSVGYDDGDAEDGIPAALIRRLADGDGDSGVFDADSMSTSQGFKVGDRVEANYAGEGDFFPGTISKVNSDGTYDLAYDDGDAETEVEAKLIRKLPGVGAGDADADAETDGGGFDADSQSTRLEFNVGDEVEADYAGAGSYFPGTISKVNGDGTYDVAYDDGDSEQAVERRSIRLLSSAAAAAAGAAAAAAGPETAASLFSVGDMVEADYGGEGTYFPGKISHVNADGTYDVAYDDGDSENAVPQELIRRVGQPDAAAEASNFDDADDDDDSQQQGGAFNVGDKIEADYGGEGSFYPGTIAKVNGGDGTTTTTYDVRYDDGDEEGDVPAARIRAATATGGGDDDDLEEVAMADDPPSSASTFAVGDTVEADYGGEGTFFPGRIDARNTDGTYAVAYDDGDREDDVPASRIKKKATAAVDDPPDGSEGGAERASSSSSKFKEGDAVEADYGGEGTYFPGKIEAVRGDGLYDIAYDDGDGEDDVPEDRIRARDGEGGPAVAAAAASAPGKFKEGDAVEADYGGEGTYFPGTIEAVKGNGLYDIAYDDGDGEDDVPESNIRPRDATAASNAAAPAAGSSKFSVGDSVEALYDGGDEWYGGRITKDNGDGTYAIECVL